MSGYAGTPHAVLCQWHNGGTCTCGADQAPKVWNVRDPKCPKDAVYVGRPTKWGNPFKIGRDRTRTQAINEFIEWINETEQGWTLAEAARQELKGKHLSCWCAPQDCHADILLEVANL